MTKASLDNSGNLICRHCNQKIEVCTDQCGTNLCGEEWIHSKTKKHECEYVVKPLNPFLTWVDKDRRRLFNEQKD